MNGSRHMVVWLRAGLLTAAMLVASGVAWAQETTAPAGDEPVWVPPREGSRESRELFGDARSIELLEALTRDADARVREQAVYNLGETDNVAALPIIARAMSDQAANVRGAAVAAAAYLGMGDFGSVISAGLNDKDKDVVVLACSCAAKRSYVAAQGQLAKLLDGDEPAVQIAALEALTSLKLAAPVARLKALLAGSSTAVRLGAVSNAALLDAAQAGALLATLADVARNDDSPAVRGAAVASLGALAFDANAPAIAEAWKDANALVRRGAVEAYIHAEKAPPIKEFFADPSPMVRLAAIRLAGQRKLPDAVPLLLDAFRNVADDLAHNAAAQSLRQIGGDAVATALGDLAGEMYKQAQEIFQETRQAKPDVDKSNAAVQKLQEALDAAQSKQTDLDRAAAAPSNAKTPQDKEKLAAAKKQADVARKDLDAARTALAGSASRAAGVQSQVDERGNRFAKSIRNLRSCCRVLGELKSPQAFDLRAEILQTAAASKLSDMVRLDSEMLIDVVLSLGQLGDPRGAEPVNKLLAALAKQAPGAGMENPPPDFCYRTSVAVAAITAVGDLHSPQELSSLDVFLNVRIKMTGRLNTENEAVMRTMGMLNSPAHKAAIEKIAGKVLGDSTYSLTVQFEAIKTCGKLGLAKNLLLIRKRLDDRADRNTMRAAAWAIKVLSDESPSVGDPSTSEGPGWIIRQK